MVGFDWDDGNRVKCQKHGVAISDIEALFAGLSRTGAAINSTAVEKRFYALGKTLTGRSLIVIFTLRCTTDRRLIRPISARYMHRKEVDRYA